VKLRFLETDNWFVVSQLSKWSSVCIMMSLTDGYE